MEVRQTGHRHPDPPRCLPLLGGVTGRYFADANDIEKSETNANGLAPHAADTAAAERLWDLTEELLAK
jgi:hypothetical protein